MSKGKQPTARRLVRVLGLSLSCGFTSLIARHALAQNHVLTWDAPPDCPGREEVLTKVREIAGDDVFAKTALHASGKIREVNGGFRLELDVVGDAGAHVRTIDARACVDLLGASAVVLGLNLRRLANADQGAASAQASGQVDSSSPSADSGSQTAQPKPQSSPTPPLSSQDPRTNDNSRPYSNDVNDLWLAVPQVHVAVGSLPAASVQWAAGFGWRSPDWLVWFSGRYQPAQMVRDQSISDAAASVTRVAGEIGLARGFRVAPFEWAPGLMIGTDYLMVEGRGADIVASRTTTAYPFVALGVSLRWLATSWLSVALNLAGELPLSRPKLMVEALGEVGQMGPVNGRLTLGSEWNF